MQLSFVLSELFFHDFELISHIETQVLVVVLDVVDQHLLLLIFLLERLDVVEYHLVYLLSGLKLAVFVDPMGVLLVRYCLYSLLKRNYFMLELSLIHI